MRSFRPQRRMRAIALVTACIAILLNAAAPVLAYAYGDVMHDVGHGVRHDIGRDVPRAAGHGSGGEHALQAATRHHVHPAQHRHSMAGADTGAHQHSSSVAHCQYCLDFAAGAALGPTPFHACAESTSRTPHRPIVVARYAGRSSLRIAEPRAPPPQA